MSSGELATYLHAGELAMAQQRASELVAHSHYPLPDEHGDWPPYPWPLI